MIQLFIDGREVDIDRTTAFPVTKQFEDLTNPTVVKNGFTKTVKLPATGRNNEVFGHIYRLDQLNFTFDPLERIPFVLTWSGNLLESGYIKLGEIRYVGDLPDSYEITMYGGLFDFFYELSEKTLDQLGVGDAAFTAHYDHQITATTVVNSWGNDYYKYILSYSGDYDNFDKGATIENVVTFPMWATVYHATAGQFIGVGQHITYISDDGLIWEKHDHSLNLTNCKYYDSALFSVVEGNDLSYFYYSYDGITWNTRNYHNNQTPYRFYGLKNSRGRLYACGNTGSSAGVMQLHLGGNGVPYEFAFTAGSVGMANSPVKAIQFHESVNYRGTIALFYQMDAIAYETHGRDLGDGEFTVVRIGGGDSFNDLAGSTDNTTGSTPVMVACGDLGALMYMTDNPEVWTPCNKVADQASAQQTLYMIEYLNGKFITVGNGGVIGVSDDGITFTYYQPYVSGSASYYSIAYGNGMYVVTGAAVIAYSYDAENWFYIRGEETGIADDVDEHQRNEYRSYYQRPCLRLKHIFNQICTESDYTVELDPDFFSSDNPYWEKTWLMMNRLSVTDSQLSQTHRGNVRSEDRISYDIMMTKGISQADFLVSFCKIFGLIVERDEVRKVVSITSRNNFFSGQTIVDWTDKIDTSKGYTLSALTFDSRYIRMGWESSGTQYEIDYEEKYSNEYGKVRRDTEYKFNKDEKELIESSVFRNLVVSQDYDYYFEGRKPGEPFRDDKILPAVYTKSNNERDQVETSLVLLFGYDTKQRVDEICITDDTEEMLRNGNYTWNSLSARTVDEIPLMTRLYAGGGSVYSLDFAVPGEYYYDVSSYPESATLYNRFWKTYIEERHDANTRVMKAYVHLTPGDMAGFRFNTFVKIKNTLWHVNKIMDYNAMDDKTTQVELVRVINPDAYVNGQSIV